MHVGASLTRAGHDYSGAKARQLEQFLSPAAEAIVHAS
jgi:hypothetical protein